jgi:translation initiation factor 2B subunit (eIF-2B alpha/beta/delta family)
MDKRGKFNKILRDIKSLKIQGAVNIAKKAFYAYSLFPSKSSIKKLLSLRPTEPMMKKVLEKASKGKDKETEKHFRNSQNKINKEVFNLIKNNDVIYTHCHSSTVTSALIYSKNKGKKFEVFNTETRPLYQGRKTARELKKAGIKVTMFVDSGMDIALSKKQGTKKVNKIFLGADALLKDGIINKIGSGMLSKLAKINNVPLYILADSWKFSNAKIKIEERNFKEVWENSPKNLKIRNPAFEAVPKKYITGIISEFGLMKYKDFLKKVKKEN